VTAPAGGVRVRPARPEEAAAVADLFNAINSMDGPPPPVPMTAEAVRRDLLGPEPRAVLLVAESDGELAGFITGNAIYDSMRAADAFLLNDLYVAPESRRRGAGRALVAGLAAVARERGAGCLWWGVDLGDQEAMLFYDALGAGDEGGFVGRILVGPAFEALARQGQA
jgi:GNAT superfamily N-acetyltransferase